MKKIVALNLIFLSSIASAQQPYQLNLPMKPVYNSFNIPVAQGPRFKEENQPQQCDKQVATLMNQMQQLQQNQQQWQQYASELKKQNEKLVAQMANKGVESTVKVDTKKPVTKETNDSNINTIAPTVTATNMEKQYGAVPNGVQITRTHKQLTYLVANSNTVTEEASNKQQKENYIKARDLAYKRYGSLENAAKQAIENNTVADFLIQNPQKAIPFIDAIRANHPNFEQNVSAFPNLAEGRLWVKRTSF